MYLILAAALAAGDIAEWPPAPTPPVTGTVKVCIESDPAGAEVHNWRNGRLLGQTPLTLVAERGKTLDIIVQKDGGRAIKFVDTLHDQKLHLALLPSPRQRESFARLIEKKCAPEARPLAAEIRAMKAHWDLSATGAWNVRGESDILVPWAAQFHRYFWWRVSCSEIVAE